MNPRPKLRIASSIVAFAMMGWLAIAPPATAAPSDVTIQVLRATEQVCVWGTTLADVRLDAVPIGVVTSAQNCLNLNPQEQDPPPIDLAPGKVVSVWEGGVKLDDLTIVDVGITYLDGPAMTAWGWVKPGATVQIQFFEQAWTWPPEDSQNITGDGNGRWTATAVGLLSDPAQVSTWVLDGDGDFSSADREADDPNIRVTLDQDSIDMGGFPPLSDGEVFVDTVPLLTFAFDEGGHAQFDPDQTDWFDFQTGQTVRVAGGSVEDELLLADPITSTIDAGADTISGTGPPDSTIWLFVFETELPQDLSTQSDGSGAWSIDTMQVAGYDLRDNDAGLVWVSDEDGDQTAQEWPTPVPEPPKIDLSYNYDPYGGWWSIEGYGFTRFTEITAEIDTEPFACPMSVPEGGIWSTDPYGNVECEDLGQGLEIGQTVTVHVGIDSDAVTVRPLTIDPPTAGETPSGTTLPNTEVTLWVDTNEDFLELTAMSDEHGVWSTPTPILEQEDHLSAWIPAQRYNRSVPNPRITVEPQAQYVSVEDFPVPAGNTGEGYTGELRVSTTGGGVCVKTVDFWNGQSSLEMWSDEVGGPWCAIRAGDTVTITNEGLTKSVVVQPLTVTSVDIDAETVSGTAAPNADVRLSYEAGDGGNGGEGTATADSSGSWTVSGLTDWNGDPWDVTRGDLIQASWMDDDGDQTRSVFVWPSLSVNPDLDHVWGWGWPESATITLHGATHAVQTVCYANVAQWYHFLEPVQGPYAMRPCDGPATGYPAVFLDLRELGVDVAPGDVVTMSDAHGRTATTTVADVRVSGVDLGASTIYGSSDISVGMNMLSALAMGWWMVGPGGWDFVLTDHPYFVGPIAPTDFGVFRGSFEGERGETVVRWYATPPVTFTGFTHPVDMSGVVNVAKAGKVIELKFRLTADGQPVLDLSTASLVIQAMACPSGVSDQIESYGKKGTGLVNLGNGYYLYRWNVPKSLAGSCQRVSIDLGSYGVYPAQPAVFRLTK